ncbi:hypothetical protein Bbelb_063210 [Branchiostoma belcheri]|nr:hypothetical protein Bbelb_063210 [Branchiostoma belcheri]
MAVRPVMEFKDASLGAPPPPIHNQSVPCLSHDLDDARTSDRRLKREYVSGSDWVNGLGRHDRTLEDQSQTVLQTYPWQRCEAKTHIVLAKNHKVGGDTVKNIINNFGYRKNLTFLLPKPFKSSMAYPHGKRRHVKTTARLVAKGDGFYTKQYHHRIGFTTKRRRIKAAAARLSLNSQFRVGWLGNPPQKSNCQSKKRRCQAGDIVGHQKTCSLVGNSGILLGSKCGREIDFKDFVVRMDLPAVSGFENDVGGRTNMTIVSPQTSNRMYKSSIMRNRSRDVYESRVRFIRETILMLDSSSKSKLRGALTRYNLSFALLNTKSRIIGMIKTRSVNQIASAISGQHWRRKPTVGLFTTLVLTTFCEKLYLYGFFPFQKDPKNRPLPYHYYPGDYVNPIVQNGGGHHEMSWEYSSKKGRENVDLPFLQLSATDGCTNFLNILRGIRQASRRKETEERKAHSSKRVLEPKPLSK